MPRQFGVSNFAIIKWKGHSVYRVWRESDDLFMGLFLASPCAVVWAAQLKGIDFKQRGELSSLEFQFDSKDFTAKSFHVREDKQIIVDLGGVAASAKVLRAFDTSEFSGSVVFVSAYPRPAHPNSIRVALQLRDNVESRLEVDANRVVLWVENRFGAFNQGGKSSGDGR